MTIYFIPMLLAAFVVWKFGVWACVLFFMLPFLAFHLFAWRSRRNHPTTWKGDGWAVSVMGSRDVTWIDYRRAEGTVTVEAEPQVAGNIMMITGGAFYYVPSYRQLSDVEKVSVLEDIGYALDRLNISYSSRSAWTSGQASTEA